MMEILQQRDEMMLFRLRRPGILWTRVIKEVNYKTRFEHTVPHLRESREMLNMAVQQEVPYVPHPKESISKGTKTYNFACV